KLRAAIKAKQNDRIDLYLAALDGRIKELNKVLRAATLARGDLREIEFDEDFVAEHLAEVEKAVTTVSDAVDGFTEQFDEGKTLHEGLVKRVKEFGEKAAANSGYSEELKKKLKDGVKDIQNKAVGVNVYVEQLALASERVKALTIDAIDVGKAAKALSIDRAGE